MAIELALAKLAGASSARDEIRAPDFLDWSSAGICPGFVRRRRGHATRSAHRFAHPFSLAPQYLGAHRHLAPFRSSFRPMERCGCFRSERATTFFSVGSPVLVSRCHRGVVHACAKLHYSRSARHTRALCYLVDRELPPEIIAPCALRLLLRNDSFSNRRVLGSNRFRSCYSCQLVAIISAAPHSGRTDHRNCAGAYRRLCRRLVALGAKAEPSRKRELTFRCRICNI